LSKLKAENLVKFDEIQEQIKKANETKNLDKLKQQIIARQDDIVKALTLKMADRDEMTKKLRLTNNYIKNMYELMKFSFLDETQDPMHGTLKQEI
tara:strand:- start:1183 stop:1467 length:285 start_codon:yes stop_codon:yes gene_type:complete